MEPITQFQLTSSDKKLGKHQQGSLAKTGPSARPKKLSKAAIETTADAFMIFFTALPDAVKWRVIQKIEEYEDALDEQDFATARVAADASAEKGIPFDQVMAEYEALHQVKLT